jgi:hypothetical protein
MIPFRSALKAHRVYDPAFGTYSPEMALQTARWKPAAGQPATIRAATVPSLADAAAKFLFDNPFDNPSAIDVSTLHLTPEGDRLEQGFPIRYPRYVYVVGGGELTDLLSALIVSYSALGSIGGRLVFGQRTLPSAVYHSHAIIVPISGGTFTNVASVPDVRMTSETDDYDAGELFVAVVQGPSVGGFYFSEGITNGNNAAYAGVSPSSTLPNYTVIEAAAGPNNLIVNMPLAAYDVALAVPHIARYKKFRQKYYYPNSPIQFGSPPVSFSTNFATLLAAVNPAGHPSVVYDGTAADVAAQIIADAMTYFTT